MSDSSGRKKKDSKKDSKSGKSTPKAGDSPSQSASAHAFTGSRINTATIYTQAFGDGEFEEVFRPVERPKSKVDSKPKRKAATEKPIRADYTYDYNFSSPSGSSKSTRTHKQQPATSRSDLEVLVDQITVETLSDELARLPEHVSAVSRFGAMVDILEKYLLRAREETTSSNEEMWASFNTPIGSVRPEVVSVLDDWMRAELTFKEQSECAGYLIKRMLRNVDKPENASAGYGMKLAAQILFRFNAWALAERLSDLKSILPSISYNVHSLPDKYAPTVLFIGAQVLANHDDDADFVALLFAIEVLGYTGFKSCDTMCLEYIARAFDRFYRKNGGLLKSSALQPEHRQLSRAVALRALADIHKNWRDLSSRPGFAKLNEWQEFLLFWALMSADPSEVGGFFNTAARTLSPSLVGKLLDTRLVKEDLRSLDDRGREVIDQLAKTLAAQLASLAGKRPAGKSSPAANSALLNKPELVPSAKKFMEHIGYEINEPESAESPNQKRRKDARRQQPASRGRRSGFCRLLFNLLLIGALIFGGVLFWRHCVNDWHKGFVKHLGKPIFEYIKPYQDLGYLYGSKYYNLVEKALRPYYTPVVDAAKPYIDLAYEFATPYVPVAKSYALTLYDLLIKIISAIYAWLQPHLDTGYTMGRDVLATVGRRLDKIPALASQNYDAYLAPYVEIIKPYTDVLCKFVAPYWEFVYDKLSQIGRLIDQYAVLD